MTDKMDKNSADYSVGLQYELTAIVREEIGFNELFASQIAQALMHGLSKKLGGQDVYIPAPSKSERDNQIKAEFNGRNKEEVCKKFKISPRRLYQIVGRR